MLLGFVIRIGAAIESKRTLSKSILINNQSIDKLALYLIETYFDSIGADA